MISLQLSRRQSLLALFLLLAVVDFANSMYVTKIRRLPFSSISYRQAGLLRKRALDQLESTGFGGLDRRRRALDAMEGAGFGFQKRALDAMEGAGFGFQKRALDTLEGNGFGFQKRALDSLDGRGFAGLSKRALDSLESGGFGFQKRALDSLDGRGFAGLNKRALDSLESGGFGFQKRSSNDRYLRVLADEWYQLELLKQELNDEIRRRQLLDEAHNLSDQQQVLIV